MRKLILIPALYFLVSINANAQIEKGAVYSDFSFGKRIFYYDTYSARTGVSIGINEHSTFGLTYTYTRYNAMPSNSWNGFGVSQRVGLSYTHFDHFKNSQRWGWFLDGSIALTRLDTYVKANGSNNLERRFTEKDISITPGIFFKPSKRVMLTANMGGLSVANNRYQSMNLRSSFAGELNLGIRISLFRKKKPGR